METYQTWAGNHGVGGAEVDPFLENVYQMMFTSYIKKTIVETRKHYYIREKTYQERVYQTNFEEIVNEMNIGLSGCESEWRPGNIIETQDLFRLIQTLTVKQRIIIAGYYLQEKTEGELARELKISRQAVNKIRRRALVNIKKKYVEDKP